MAQDDEEAEALRIPWETVRAEFGFDDVGRRARRGGARDELLTDYPTSARRTSNKLGSSSRTRNGRCDGEIVDRPFYFDELLERIRDIRASEARVYQRIREIFALASDYVEGQQETLRFFAFMQNKMHHAATGSPPRRSCAGAPTPTNRTWG
jgi:hypothetical protein